VLGSFKGTRGLELEYKIILVGSSPTDADAIALFSVLSRHDVTMQMSDNYDDIIMKMYHDFIVYSAVAILTRQYYFQRYYIMM
jgi:hypothetical protein